MLLSLLLLCMSGPVEATSLLGTPLHRSQLSDKATTRFEKRLAEARAKKQAEPDEAFTTFGKGVIWPTLAGMGMRLRLMALP